MIIDTDKIPAYHRMSVSLLRLLCHVYEVKVCRPLDISEALDLTRPDVTGLLCSAEGKGLIARKANKKDGRSHFIKMTPKGKGVVEAFRIPKNPSTP